MSRAPMPRTWLPLLIALLATAAVIGTIDPGGSYPELAEGPGITLDEVFNVEMGVYQWRAVREHGWRLWTPEVRRQVFADGPGQPYNPDHPPLGRIWLGLWHDLARWAWPPIETGAHTVTVCARVGSAIAFGLTVFLAGSFAARWYGRVAGWSAGAALACMPHVFAHAHLAALETAMNLSFTATLLFAAHSWGRVPEAAARPPKRWTAVAVGVLLGAAFLTKIQAILLPIPLAAYAVWQWRMRGMVLLMICGVVAGAVFLVGWPWLWLDPVAHVQEYFGSGVERQTLNCYYLGEKYADRDVPWHYPFILFAVSVPVGLHALAAAGLFSRQIAAASSGKIDVGSRSRTLFLAATILFVLAFFAIPGIPVYDSTRLFLVVYPLWAILAGAGAQWAFECLALRWSARGGTLAIAGLIALQGIGVWMYHPCQLSYYNLATGGLRGAAAAGMERSYWQDSITRELLTDLVASVPEGAVVDLAPRMHPIQEIDLMLQSPLLANHRVRLRAYDDQRNTDSRYVLVFRRRADQWDSLEPAPREAKLLAEVVRDGVQLSALYEMPLPAARAP